LSQFGFHFLKNDSIWFSPLDGVEVNAMCQFQIFFFNFLIIF